MVAAGEGAGFAIGDRVCALVAGGGYAEYARRARRPVPAGAGGADMVEAAALPETLFTVWSNLFERGDARDGETVLVHGGTSGIGTMAIALCGLVRGQDRSSPAAATRNAAAPRRLGAAHAINYRDRGFRRRGGGDDRRSAASTIVLDMVGGDYLPRNLALPGRGRPPRLDRRPARRQGRDQHRPDHAAPADPDRLDAPAALGRLQDAAARRDRARGLAAGRRRGG